MTMDLAKRLAFELFSKWDIPRPQTEEMILAEITPLLAAKDARIAALEAENERLKECLKDHEAWQRFASTFPEEHVAWCRFIRHQNGNTTICTCDSDVPGAFKVWRRPANVEALEQQVAHLCSDASETDRDIRDLAKRVLPAAQVDGDSVCVPPLQEVVGMLVGKLRGETQAE
jgi:hypothetical protein